MSTTATLAKTLRRVLNSANLNELASALQQLKFGNMLSQVKVVTTGLTAAASFDITTAAVKAAATITGLDLASGENLPAINLVKTLRVTASGTAGSLGVYLVCDASATPAIPPTATAYAGAAVGVATLSNDGKTLTFPNTITAFVIEYMPLSAVDLGNDYAPST